LIRLFLFAAISGAPLATTALAQIPIFETQPQNQIEFVGSSATFAVNASGATAYQWLSNGTAIVGAVSPSLTLTNLTAAQSGTLYAVIVSGPGGSITSGEAKLTVLPIPPSSATAYVGLPFWFAASPNYAATEFAASGLPSGLSINLQTGAVSGSATTTGTYSATVAASTGSTVLTWTLTITVANAPVSFVTFANTPVTGIAADPSGNVYLTNQLQNTVSNLTTGIIAGNPGVAGAFDGTGSNALFNAPTAIAVDSSGNLYVADTGNSTIRKISPSGVVSTLAGFAGLTGDLDGTGSSARFSSPTGVAVDSSGNVYVSDTGNSAIRKISPAGVVTSLVGSAAGINQPCGIAVDGSGDLYVVNSGTLSLLKITPVGMVSTIAAGLSPIQGSALGTLLSAPGSVALDSAGNAYVLIGGFWSGHFVDGGASLFEISPSGAVKTIYTEGAITSNFIGALAFITGNELLIADNNVHNSSGVASSYGTLISERIVPSGPIIISQPQSQVIGPAQEGVTLSVEATGEPGSISYQWQFNGSNIPLGTNSYLTFSPATQTQAGTYTVIVSNPYGAVVSAPAILEVVTGPAILIQPQGQAVEQSANVTLTVTASTGASYQWQYNGQNIVGSSLGQNVSGANSSTLTISQIAPDQAGNYTVVVKLAGQSITSVPAVVQVYFDFPLSPGPPLTSQSVNQGASATFNSPFYGADYFLQWEKNDIPIAGATGTSYTVPDAQPSDGGTYSVVAMGAYPAQSPGVSLKVNAAPGATYLNNWSASTPLLSGVQYTSAAFDGGNFLVVGTDGSLFLSGNGRSWSRIASAPGQINSLIYAGAPYGILGVGNNGDVVSFAGRAYASETQISSTSNLLTGIAVGGGRMVAVGYSGTAISSGFSTPEWVTGFTGTSNNLNAIAYGNGVYVAVGLGATVLTSPDGLLWTAQNLGATADLYSVAYGPAGFVAIGDSGSSGVIYTSPDGITWTSEPAPATAILVRVIYANNTFIAVGASGTIFTSTDGGFTWAAQNSGTTATLEGVAFGLNEFVVAGSGGTIADSATAAVRLGNISARAFVGTGSNDLIAGFVTTGTGTKQLLIRGIGPTLTQFDVSGVLGNPQLTLFNGASVPIAMNTDWGGSPALSAVFTQVGAFALPPTSADTAMVQTLAPGLYTAQVNGANSTTGVALAEIYDADTGTPSSRLVNLSSRAFVGTGSNVLIAGFVVSGNTAETVLIRGIGPGLSPYGLTGLLTNPVLAVYDSNSNLLATNTAWGGTAALTNAYAQVGAFSLPANSNDTALLMALPPGNYSAEVSGASNATGVALIEIYEVQ
jgi:hypothetical protein